MTRRKVGPLYVPKTVICVICAKAFTRKNGHDQRSLTCSRRCRKEQTARRMKTYASRYPVRGGRGEEEADGW